MNEQPNKHTHGTLAAISNVADSTVPPNGTRLNLLIHNTSAVSLYVRMGTPAPTPTLNDAIIEAGDSWQTDSQDDCFVRAADGTGPTVPYREDFRR